MTIISEIGVDMSRFETVKHFTLWLGLRLGAKISGAKVLGKASKRSANRTTQALKLAAAALRSSRSALGAYYRYRRLCPRMDNGKAVTAAAHKLVRMVYLMLICGQEYIGQGKLYCEERCRERVVRGLTKKAAELGLQLTPAATPA